MASVLRVLANMFLLHKTGHSLQSGSSAKINIAQELPTLAESSALFQDPVYDDIDAKITTLKQILHSVQDRAIASLQQKKTEYEHVLKEDLARSSTLQISNKNLWRKIDGVQQTNQKLREETQKLVMSNAKLSENLKFTMSNIALAKEFAVRSLGQADMNFSSPELSVLNELNDRDKEAHGKEERSRMLDDIENNRARVSLYQLNSRQPGLDSRALLKALSASLDYIPQQEKVSEEKLTMQFNEQHGKIQAAIAALLQQQVLFNQTLTDKLANQKRLYDARDYLSNVHQELVQRSVGLKEFELKLGSNPSPSQERNRIQVG